MDNEVDLIAERAGAAGLDPRVYGIHLLSRITILNYIRIADDIRRAKQVGKILDWGCSYGQMSFLLKRRGFDVASYDLGDQSSSGPSPVFPEVIVRRGIDPVRIPYPDGGFDAVLSCGVLEHVEDEGGSLQEIYRILRAGGFFFVYNLPQRGSYKEFLLARLHAGYSHARKYTLVGARQLLETNGFHILVDQRTGMLPHNLGPLPNLRGSYNRLAKPVLTLDRMLSSIPLLNRLAESLELIAVKPD